MPEETRNALLTALDNRWQDYRTQFKACRRELAEKAVHDLRVSVRRLLAALDIIRTLDARPRVLRARRFVKNLLDDLDDLRDVQVMLAETLRMPEPTPMPRPFQEHLEKREKKLMRRVHKRLETSKPAELHKRIEKIQGELENASNGPNFASRLFQAVDNFYLKAVQASAQIDGVSPESIHRARIAFKKFRYCAEIVQPLLADFPEDNLKRMHDYQGRLGNIRDLEVLLSALGDFVGKDNSAFDPEPMRGAYERRHADLVAAHLADRSELSLFWRAAPDQSFPWENIDDTLSRPSRNRDPGHGRRHRGRGQPAIFDRPRAQENAPDRAGFEGIGNSDRPDAEQPVPARDPDGEHPGQEA